MTTSPDKGPELQFKAFLAEGRFMIQRSKKSGRSVFYPRLCVPGDGDADLEWVEASGRGTVYSITVNRKKEGSHNVALIDLAEGVRMMSQVKAVESLPIGSRVTARIEKTDDQFAVFFYPEGGAA